MKTLISRYLKKNDLYVFYIHPFELSKLDIPEVPSSTSIITKFRFAHGRDSVEDKITRLVDLLRSNGYTFTTFSEIQKDIVSANGD